MAVPEYGYLAIQSGRRVVAHVFVAPQELSGLDIGYTEPDDDEDTEAPCVAGEVFIGNPQDGYYTIDFELATDDEKAGPFSFGDEEYDLQCGRCFVVEEGYEIVQLPYQSKDRAARYLAKQMR